LIDPMGRKTIWDYDLEGRLIGKQYADGSRVSYAYENATPRLKTVVDEKGQFKVYEYNADDSPRRISYPNAKVATPTVTFTYDPNYNRLLSMQDGIGLTAWSYYPPGVLGAMQASAVNGPLANEVVTYQYDALGRVVTRAINGVAQTLAYDALGRVTNVVNALGTFSYAYDGASPRLLDVSYPSGQAGHFAYFGNLMDKRLQQITHQRPDASLISRFVYGYDPVGEITNWVQQLGAQAQTWSIGYDPAGQLLAVAQSGDNPVSYSYTYDPAGNRLSEATNGVLRTFQYNALNQLLASSDVDVTNAAYEWDAEQRLVAIVRGTNRSEFSYDGLDRRVRILETVGGLTQAERRFVWCGSEVCEEHDASDAVANRYFRQGEQQGGTNLFYARDHLGNIRELTDGSAAVRAEYGYAPYGSPARLAGDLAASFGFTGHFSHQPSGLNLAWYRAYHPGSARWLGRDSIGEAGGVNLYTYALNSPIHYMDPNGKNPVFLFLGAVIVVGAIYFAVENAHNSAQPWQTSSQLQHQSGPNTFTPQDEALFHHGPTLGSHLTAGLPFAQATANLGTIAGTSVGGPLPLSPWEQVLNALLQGLSGAPTPSPTPKPCK
jgi:RHS repeat-associated protein